MWKAACDLLYSELNGSEYDNNSRIQSCPVAEHSLWDRVAEISKKKKKKKIFKVYRVLKGFKVLRVSRAKGSHLRVSTLVHTPMYCLLLVAM